MPYKPYREPDLSGDMVKVVIVPAEYECPYAWEWMDRPFSDAPGGDWGWNRFDREAIEIPRAQYERWVAAREESDRIQAEMDALKGAGRSAAAGR